MKKQLIFLFFLPLISFGQLNEFTTLPSMFDFFLENEITEITLEAEFDSILESKRFDSYLIGNLSFTDKTDTPQVIPIQLKQRGKYRRRICEFPPLRIKFNENTLSNLNLNPQFNKLKLVSHCMDDKYSSRENILREYLAYKLFEFHSEKHFRVHLVKIKYKNPKEKKSNLERYGILLEEEENLAQRCEGKIYDVRYCVLDKMNVSDIHLNSIFQYMIGNSDWDPVKVRNIKLIQKDTLEPLCIVPYDFDFSGLVNASYAIPNPNYKIKHVRDRVMICKFKSKEELEKMTQHFLSKKDFVLDYCKNFKALPKSSRKDITSYLKDFYKILENKENCESLLLEK